MPVRGTQGISGALQGVVPCLVVLIHQGKSARHAGTQSRIYAMLISRLILLKVSSAHGDFNEAVPAKRTFLPVHTNQECACDNIVQAYCLSV